MTKEYTAVRLHHPSNPLPSCFYCPPPPRILSEDSEAKTDSIHFFHAGLWAYITAFITCSFFCDQCLSDGTALGREGSGLVSSWFKPLWTQAIKGRDVHATSVKLQRTSDSDGSRKRSSIFNLLWHVMNIHLTTSGTPAQKHSQSISHHFIDSAEAWTLFLYFRFSFFFSLSLFFFFLIPLMHLF